MGSTTIKNKDKEVAYANRKEKVFSAKVKNLPVR